MTVTSALEALSGTRPIFHSEADFQHALAWQLKEVDPSLRMRLERPYDTALGRVNLDLLVLGEERLAIELKYWKKGLDTELGGERFMLKNVGAHDLGRYDFWKDVVRVETLVREGHVDRGFAIALTNDPSYWRAPTGRETTDRDFRLHEGREVGGRLAWLPRTGGTSKGREAALELSGRYSCDWQPFSQIDESRAGIFRMLVITVDRLSVGEPATPLAAGQREAAKPRSARRSKYAPLEDHLRAATGSRVTMSFAEIEALVGGLPASARTHPAWWGNTGQAYSPQAKAWDTAGWKASGLDLAGERVNFERS